MKTFYQWLENNRLLARSYKDALKDIPQDPIHHPEGSVLNHVKLVRKSILKAVKFLKELQKDNAVVGEILADINFDISVEEQRILNLSAWLHDIGKITATKTNDKGKIQAIGHETEDHYLPQIEKFKSIAPREMVELYESNKELIHFLIERHMDFAHGGFGKVFISNNFVNGKLKNDNKLKLLLILKWADKMGRSGNYDLQSNINKLIEASEKSKKRTTNMANQHKPFSGSREELKQLLKNRGVSDSDIEKALISKFGA